MFRPAAAAIAVSIVSCSLLACDPMKDPSPGVPDYQSFAIVEVPSGSVNVAGGNYLYSRSLLALDTRLGPTSIGLVYNSADGAWRWNHDVTYDGVLMTDASGATYDVGSLADGAAIPGSTFVKIDSSRIKSKGGRLMEFSEGRLSRVRWTSSETPKLEFSWGNASGEIRLTRIEACDVNSCSDLYSFTYDSSARLRHIDDWASRRASIDYDSIGRISSIQSALDVARGWPGHRFSYNGALLVQVRDSADHLVEITYGAGSSERVLSVQQVGEESPMHRFAYYSESYFRTVHTDPTGYETDYVWDGLRRIRAVSVAGDTTTYEWTEMRVTRTIGPDGSHVSVSHTDDDPTTIVESTGNIISITYAADAVNRESPAERPISEISDTLGWIERRNYDANGRLVSIERPADEGTPESTAEIESFSYHPDESIESVTDAFGVVTRFEQYGRHGHAARIELPTETRALTFDGVGNVVSGDDFGFEFGPGSGGVLARQFDENRNLVSLTVMNQPAPLGVEESGVVDLLYNPDGQLAEIRRPAGGDTRFHYDSIGRLTHRSERVSEGGTAAWQTTTLGYDASGRLTSRSLPNGGMETWTYGPGGRLRSASVQEDGVQQSRADYTYQNGRLVSILDDAYGIASETLHHDAETGLLERVVYPTGESIRYERDLRGRIVSRTLVRADGSVLRRIQYEYDSAGREKRILDGGTLLLERKRDGGKIVWIKYGNQMKHSRQYDGFDGSLVSSRLKQTDTGRIEAETVFESLYGAPCLSDVCFSAYTTAQHSLSAALESYQVGTAIGSDDLKMSGRRVVQGPGDDFQDVGTKFFEFDLLSNLVKMSNHYEPRCGDQTGELTAVYNAERNRLLRMDWSEGCTGVAHAYSYDEAGYVIERDGVQIDWDGAGRALRVGDMAEFEWDTQGRMVSRTLDGIRTVFLYGGFVEADASLEPVAIDLGDVRISLVAGVGNRYRHYDFRGNVQFVTDESGFIVKHYRYGAFGALQQVGDSDDPFAFGRGLSVEGLVLLGARLLDQDAGRFLGPDPEFQILNQHSYTMGNPVFLWDPDGRSAIAVPTPPAIGPTEAGWGWTAFYTTAVYGGGLVGFRLGGQFGVVPGALAGFIVAENVYQISTGRQGTSWRDILEHFDPSVAPKGSPKPADYYRNLSADSGRPGTKAKGLHAQGPDAGYVDYPISIGGFACGLGFEAGLGVAIAFGLRRRLRRRSTLQSPSRGRRGHPDGE